MMIGQQDSTGGSSGLLGPAMTMTRNRYPPVLEGTLAGTLTIVLLASPSSSTTVVGGASREMR